MPDGPDWGDGDYGRIAATLAPAAEVVLDAAGVARGERVLDVACGTGNAALAAARRGAAVVGVDRAEPLLAIARERMRDAGLHAEFVVGDALDLPVRPRAFDVAVSVFGVIFAPDPDRAIAELLRTARRHAVTSWVPAGPISAAGRLLLGATAGAKPSLGEPPRWGDPGWVAERLGHQGARAVEVREDALPFTAASPAAWFDEQVRHHPVWRWARRRLDDERWADLRERSVAALAAENESADAFMATSRYLVVTARSPDRP